MSSINDTASRAIVPSYACDERSQIATRLGVTEEQLKRAVRMVGSRLSTVRAYLGK